MNRIRELWFRLQPFWRRKKIETGLSDEIQSHLEMAIEANVAAGMSPEDARYAALREFGGVEQIKERYRDERGFRWIEETLGDIRIAARSLRKSPGFTTVAVLTLALCIGANSAVFSVVHAILLKPYPWPDSDRLVRIFNTHARTGLERTGVSVPDYFDRRRVGLVAGPGAGRFHADRCPAPLPARPRSRRSLSWWTPRTPPRLPSIGNSDFDRSPLRACFCPCTRWRHFFRKGAGPESKSLMTEFP